MYSESIDDPDAFWGREGQRLDWIKPWTKLGQSSFDEADFGIAWFAAVGRHRLVLSPEETFALEAALKAKGSVAK